MSEDPTRSERPTREYPVVGQQPTKRPTVTPARGGLFRRSTVAMGLAAIFVVGAAAVAMSQTGGGYGSPSQPVVLAGQETTTTVAPASGQPTEPTTTVAKAKSAPASGSVPATCAARDARERAEDLADARQELAEAQETPAQEAARKRAEDLADAKEELAEARETPAQRAARKLAEDKREAAEDLRKAQENLLCGEYHG